MSTQSLITLQRKTGGGTAPAMDFEAEADRSRCGAIKEFWYVAGLSRELGTKAPIARTILGVPLVLFRDKQGQVGALVDRCLHRNAMLSRGELWEGNLCCPYHGWTYDRSGSCVNVPSLGPSQGEEGVLGSEERESAGLRRAPCEVGQVESFPTLEQDGQIFVYMGGDAPPRRAPFRTPYYGEPGWVVYYMVTDFPNGVTNLVENFMDVPHTVFVHRGWFRKPEQLRVPARVERRDGSVIVTYEEGSESLSGLGELFKVTGKPVVHTDKYYMPNVTRVDYSWGDCGFAITSQTVPISGFSSRVYTAISYKLPKDLPGNWIARLMKPFVHWYTRRVILQDVVIAGVQAEGLQSVGPPRFQSTEADLLHADIESYRAWLLKGGECPPPSDEDRRIYFWL